MARRGRAGSMQAEPGRTWAGSMLAFEVLVTTLRPTAIFGLLVCAACGSSSGSTLFSGSGMGKGLASSGGAQGTGTGGRVGASGSGNALGFSGSTTSGGNGGLARLPDGAIGSGGSISVPDARVPVVDGATSLNAATPGTIFCAGTECTIAGTPTNTCCVGIPPFPTTCLPSFPGCVNAGIISIACDDAADCLNGQVCCGNLSGQNAGSRCASTCASPSFQVCRTSAECPSHRCAPLAQAQEYGACQ